MIDVQPYIDKVEVLRGWLMAWIDVRCWTENPLKPTPWDSFNKIWEIK